MCQGSAQTFHQRRHTDGHQAHDETPKVIVSREMKIRAARRYRFTPTRTAVIGHKENDKCWGRCGPTHTAGGKMVWPP